jgi:hypothetical protein
MSYDTTVEDFGVNDGISLILRLLDQLHGLRRSARRLEP